MQWLQYQMAMGIGVVGDPPHGAQNDVLPMLWDAKCMPLMLSLVVVWD